MASGVQNQAFVAEAAMSPVSSVNHLTGLYPVSQHPPPPYFWVKRFVLNDMTLDHLLQSTESK